MIWEAIEDLGGGSDISEYSSVCYTADQAGRWRASDVWGCGCLAAVLQMETAIRREGAGISMAGELSNVCGGDVEGI